MAAIVSDAPRAATREKNGSPFVSELGEAGAPYATSLRSVYIKASHSPHEVRTFGAAMNSRNVKSALRRTVTIRRTP
ncbi:hypothetical protein [Paraburkholderia caffeinilytica]|uniref:hypothetical protein n=1 Tax=Paraburkholderia caffeinilytica TaxID=1761016 RepID=UPI0038BC0F93